MLWKASKIGTFPQFFKALSSFWSSYQREIAQTLARTLHCFKGSLYVQLRTWRDVHFCFNNHLKPNTHNFTLFHDFSSLWRQNWLVHTAWNVCMCLRAQSKVFLQHQHILILGIKREKGNWCALCIKIIENLMFWVILALNAWYARLWCIMYCYAGKMDSRTLKCRS